MSNIKRFIPLTLLIIGLALFFYFKLYRYLSFTQLKAHRDWLLQWTKTHYALAVLAYFVIYIVAVAISIPGAIFLTLTGGFLFGILFGTLYTVIAATLGATLLFISVKTAFGTWFANKANTWVSRMQQGFQKNAFYYLLFLRLIPLFPFWAVNIVPALLNMRLRSFILATFIGIIPGSLVYVALGNGLQDLFATNQTPNLSIIFKPTILLPILALAVLSLVPILYKKMSSRTK
jgi:uncharacterized membrane protein YdjX (TVP38/TMEM64 family)